MKVTKNPLPKLKLFSLFVFSISKHVIVRSNFKFAVYILSYTTFWRVNVQR